MIARRVRGRSKLELAGIRRTRRGSLSYETRYLLHAAKLTPVAQYQVYTALLVLAGVAKGGFLASSSFVHLQSPKP